MKIRTLFYVIGQGFKSLFKHKMFTLASMATISACLFLFGLVFAVFLNLQSTLQNVQEGVSFTVFFEDDITDEEKYAIGESLQNRKEDVASCVYISPEQAWDGFKEQYLGEYADGFTENPLESSDNYEVYLYDISKQQEIIDYVETLPGVEKVNSSQITANILSGMNSLVTYVAIGIIFILLAVSIFLISNTVMIGISVRKEEIAIMKFIGATDFFVRSPFIIEGVLIGTLGSIIPLVVFYYTYDKVITFIATKFSFMTNILRFTKLGDLFHYLGPVSLGLGVGIGFIGSMLTVKKHLRV
ncbi:MAG: permease-like cell division protein FtsX [Lachnospiraceae bacterium]|nr:permease-like cell division protein FtsX [Lachnospiraceae bacterium]